MKVKIVSKNMEFEPLDFMPMPPKFKRGDRLLISKPFRVGKVGLFSDKIYDTIHENAKCEIIRISYNSEGWLYPPQYLILIEDKYLLRLPETFLKENM